MAHVEHGHQDGVLTKVLSYDELLQSAKSGELGDIDETSLEYIRYPILSEEPDEELYLQGISGFKTRP